MRRAIDEAMSVDVLGRHQQVAGGRQVAEHARARLEALGIRLGDVGEAPHRHPAPTLRGREEVPVAHRLTEDRVGDVVRGESECIDLQQSLPVHERRRLGLGDAGLPQIVASDQEVAHRRKANRVGSRG